MRISKRRTFNAKKGRYLKGYFNRLAFILRRYYKSLGFEIRYDKKHNALEYIKV